MHDHDLDLIAAYVDGTDEHGEGRRLVESCPDCRREFTAQVEVRERLASLAAPVLTQSEQKALRTAIDRELDQGATITPLTRRWAQIGAVAAALIVVAGVGGALVRGSGRDQGGESSTITAQLRAGSNEAAATTASPAIAGAAPEAFDTASEKLGTVTAEQFRSHLAQLRDEAAAAADSIRTLGTAESGSEEPPPCVDSLENRYARTIQAVVDGRPVVGFVTADTDPPLAVAFYADNCEVFDLDG